MRFMHWSYADLRSLPAFHLDVLIEMIEEEQREAAHQRALAEIRGQMRRR